MRNFTLDFPWNAIQFLEFQDILTLFETFEKFLTFALVFFPLGAFINHVVKNLDFLVTFRPLFGHYLATFWPLFGHFSAFFRSLFANFLKGTFWPFLRHFSAFFRPFFGHYLATFWPLFRHFLATFRVLFCHFPVTFLSLFGHFQGTFRPFFRTCFGHFLATFLPYFGHSSTDHVVYEWSLWAKNAVRRVEKVVFYDQFHIFWLY